MGTGSAVVAQSAEAVDALLDVDPNTLGDDDVHATVVGLARQQARLAALCDRHNRNDELRHDPHPFPERPIDRRDELRARIRWQLRHEPVDDDPDNDNDHDPDDQAV